MVKLVAQSWEANEKENLRRDIDTQMEYLNSIENNYSEVVQNFTQEEEQAVEGVNANIGEQELNEKQLLYEQEHGKWEKVIEQLKQEQVKGYIQTLSKFRVLKYSQLLQIILIFLGYEKKQINIEGTNQLDWKNVKLMLNDEQFFNKIFGYNYKGAKPEQVKDYAKIQRLSGRLE